MKKKLFKYIKFLISLTLILSLVVPSYASLSASDGSAFVTKAEFDSALADFNSRLTTFEAGINSKIDSQVTSYLDRNGIWSRKVQNIVNYSFGNLFMFYPLGVFESPAVDTIQTRNYVLNGTNTTIYFSAPLPIKTSTDNSRNWTIIEEFNKSGMFVCTSAFTAIAGNSSLAWDYDKYKDDDTFHTSTKSKVGWFSTALGKWYADNEDKTSDFDSILTYKNDVNVNCQLPLKIHSK